jgi:hypothetical protein
MTPRPTPSVTASAITAAAAKPSWSFLDRTRFPFRVDCRATALDFCVPDDSRAGGYRHVGGKPTPYPGVSSGVASPTPAAHICGAQTQTGLNCRRPAKVARPERGLRRQRIGGEVARGGQYPATRGAAALDDV